MFKRAYILDPSGSPRKLWGESCNLWSYLLPLLLPFPPVELGTEPRHSQTLSYNLSSPFSSPFRQGLAKLPKLVLNSAAQADLKLSVLLPQFLK